MIRKLVLEKADRLYHLPSVIDEFLPRRRGKTIIRQDVIDLARFGWPQGEEFESPAQSCQPATDKDKDELCQLTAEWYKNRFGGKINPAKEVFIGGSIRQILNLLALVYFNSGDMVLVPDPGIWHYRAAVALASAEAVPYHLLERNKYKLSVNALTGNLVRLSKAIYVNSPQNPTGQSFTKDDLGELLHLAGKENLLVILDQAFNSFVDDDHPSSIFSLPGGRKVGIELYSYAYNFGQSTSAPAFAIGQPALIANLRRLARVFGLLLTNYQIRLGLQAIEERQRIDSLRIRFGENRKLADELCKKLRLTPSENRVGPFYWTKLPGRKQSRRFCRFLYLRCGILTVPGVAFGENGEGFVRLSLTADSKQYQKAIEAADKLFQAQRKKAHG